LKVAKNDGKDIFGRPFKLSTVAGANVVVDPETIKELGKKNVIGADYWRGLGE
jgi:hypothetical protein